MSFEFGSLVAAARNVERLRYRLKVRRERRKDRRDRLSEEADLERKVKNRELEHSDPDSCEAEMELSARLCPQCGDHFRLVTMGGIQVDFCVDCSGSWFDTGEIGALTELGRDLPDGDAGTKRSKYTCPVCQTRMKKLRFRKGRGLWVDACLGHGVFLEAGELPQLLQFAREDKDASH